MEQLLSSWTCPVPSISSSGQRSSFHTTGEFAYFTGKDVRRIFYVSTFCAYFTWGTCVCEWCVGGLLKKKRRGGRTHGEIENSIHFPYPHPLKQSVAMDVGRPCLATRCVWWVDVHCGRQDQLHKSIYPGEFISTYLLVYSFPSSSSRSLWWTMANCCCWTIAFPPPCVYCGAGVKYVCVLGSF